MIYRIGVKTRIVRVMANTGGIFRKTGIPIMLSNKHITNKRRPKREITNKVGVGGKGLHKIPDCKVVYSVRRLNSAGRVCPRRPRGNVCVFSRSARIKTSTMRLLNLRSIIFRCRVASGHMSYCDMMNVTHRTTTAFGGRFGPPIIARAKGSRSIGSCMGIAMRGASLYSECYTETIGGVGVKPSPG